jgi:hypothetical protein
VQASSLQGDALRSTQFKTKRIVCRHAVRDLERSDAQRRERRDLRRRQRRDGGAGVGKRHRVARRHRHRATTSSAVACRPTYAVAKAGLFLRKRTQNAICIRPATASKLAPTLVKVTLFAFVAEMVTACFSKVPWR